MGSNAPTTSWLHANVCSGGSGGLGGSSKVACFDGNTVKQHPPEGSILEQQGYPSNDYNIQ